MDEAKKSFKPEFLNRLTEIVIFRPLAEHEIHRGFGIGQGCQSPS